MYDDAIDPRILTKVRALLAKAESTSFVEEAESLTEKAQELMARYAIEQAMIAAADSRDAKPTSIQITIDNPYASAKSILVSAVARGSRCQAVWSSELRLSTVFGFRADLAAVELLYASLLLQATAAMTSAGDTDDPHFRSRGFRHAFLVAFAHRIGQRLASTRERTVDAAFEDHGTALVPMLEQRDAAVDAALEAAFPYTRRGRTTASDARGWTEGARAADRASLNYSGEVRGKRPALRLMKW